MATPVPKPASDARQRRAEVGARRLPSSGRAGPVPRCPVKLGPDGKRWWSWAWKTPQATTWHAGVTETLVKRAQLEDRFVGATTEADMARAAALIYRFDDALGLTPAGAAKLHFTFVDDDPEPKGPTPKNVTPIRNRLKGMRE